MNIDELNTALQKTNGLHVQQIVEPAQAITAQCLPRFNPQNCVPQCDPTCHPRCSPSCSPCWPFGKCRPQTY